MTMTARTTGERGRARRPGGADARSADDAAPSARLLALQRAVGNRAVTSLVQRTCTGGGCCAACAATSDEAPAEASDDAAHTAT
jgi:hypothetical protein